MDHQIHVRNNVTAQVVIESQSSYRQTLSISDPLLFNNKSCSHEFSNFWCLYWTWPSLFCSHSSFTRYVPLGGKRAQIWSMWIIFTFVGLWHDLWWVSNPRFCMMHWFTIFDHKVALACLGLDQLRVFLYWNFVWALVFQWRQESGWQHAKSWVAAQHSQQPVLSHGRSHGSNLQHHVMAFKRLYAALCLFCNALAFLGVIFSLICVRNYDALILPLAALHS